MSITQTTQSAFAVGGEVATATARRVHIVMDHNGDTRHEFDAADPDALGEAAERYRHLTAHSDHQ